MVSELVNQKVVQHNDLITSMAKMNRVTLKIFELAVSFIDVNDPPIDNMVTIRKDVIYKFMDENKSTARSHELKEAILTLHRQAIFEMVEGDKPGRTESIVISPISSSRWNNYDNNLNIKFNDEIMPYLIELRKNFTQYSILDLVKLNSKYSIILYKWLTMNYNQYERYRYTNKRTRTQLDQLKNPYIDIEELRRITDTSEEYERMFDFEKNVLQVAKEEINQYTRFMLDYEKEKSGRYIKGIRFTIDQKPKKAALPYKENDDEHMDDLRAKEENKGELFAKAMKSPYTTILGAAMILSLKEFQDDDVMASLQAFVYPLYDELKEKRGIKGVEEHVAYVAQHKQGYSEHKQNIVKYLKRAIDQYLVTVELQDLD